ncbi:MAG: PaaI family thioesterase [Alphaproteobacteria bacterium]|nr:MAG: PaaI family thioesterase [Alphaproteobacteria bacterium]
MNARSDVSADERSKPGSPEAALYRCDGEITSSTWVNWRIEDSSRFNGQFGELQTRCDGDRAIVRFRPHFGLGNIAGNVHGGAVMTMIDMAMFIGAQVLGLDSAARGLTVDCNVQFVGGADLERPVDAVVQITRETGRFLFVRGTVEQGGDMIASYIGILRKHRP